MSKQPEALRIANDLCSAIYADHLDAQAASELRRLHAANVELLEVLNAIVRSAELNQAAINTFLLIDARAAIAKHGSTS